MCFVGRYKKTMEALEFNKLSTMTNKLTELGTMNEKDKIRLFDNQNSLVFKNWSQYIDETGNKLNNFEYDGINDKILFFDTLISYTDWTYKKFIYEQKEHNNLFQWDIFYCDLGYNIGYEKNKKRPVLIIQKTKGYLEAKTVMVAPITTGENTGIYYKHEVEITETKYNIINGKIDLSQIRAVDKSRLTIPYCDRLLKQVEYQDKFGANISETMQEKIKKRIKELFTIDI
jgi:mRNA-degrading endonuclease toxin of MazEF toxin-antitoxin module